MLTPAPLIPSTVSVLPKLENRVFPLFLHFSVCFEPKQITHPPPPYPPVPSTAVENPINSKVEKRRLPRVIEIL